MALVKYLSIQYVDSSVITQDNNQQLSSSSRLGFVCAGFIPTQTKIWVLLEIQPIDLVIHTIHHHISIMDNNDQLKTTAAAASH